MNLKAGIKSESSSDSVESISAADLRTKIKLKNYLTLSEALIRAMLLRKESRGSHFREDYPSKKRDYKKNILISRENDKLKAELDKDKILEKRAAHGPFSSRLETKYVDLALFKEYLKNKQEDFYNLSYKEEIKESDSLMSRTLLALIPTAPFSSAAKAILGIIPPFSA